MYSGVLNCCQANSMLSGWKHPNKACTNQTAETCSSVHSSYSASHYTLSPPSRPMTNLPSQPRATPKDNTQPAMGFATISVSTAKRLIQQTVNSIIPTLLARSTMALKRHARTPKVFWDLHRIARVAVEHCDSWPSCKANAEPKYSMPSSMSMRPYIKQSAICSLKLAAACAVAETVSMPSYLPALARSC